MHTQLQKQNALYTDDFNPDFRMEKEKYAVGRSAETLECK